MLSYTFAYIVVPVLLFNGTRSLQLAGMALIGEGLARALFSVMAGRVHSRLGTSRSMLLAEALRLAAVAAILTCIWQFSMPLLVLSSVVYQFGFALVMLEQELRCGALKEQHAACQAAYRIAEGTAVFPVLAATYLLSTVEQPLVGLALLGGLFSLLHFVLSRRWLQGSTGGHLKNGTARDGVAFLLSNTKLRHGLLASMLGFGVFSLCVAATPFLLAGRHLGGLDLTSPTGLAAFKAAAAALSVVSAISLAKQFATAKGPFLLLGLGAISGGTLFVSQLDVPAVVAFVALTLTAAATMSIILGQRTYRQQAVPSHKLPSVTAGYLAAECLGISVAGVFLLSGHVAAVGLIVAVVFSALHWRQHRPTVVAAALPA